MTAKLAVLVQRACHREHTTSILMSRSTPRYPVVANYDPDPRGIRRVAQDIVAASITPGLRPEEVEFPAALGASMLESWLQSG